VQIEGQWEETPRASSRDLKDFIEGPIWRDISAYLQQQISSDTDSLVQEVTIDRVRQLQGRITAYRSLLGYPQGRLNEAIEMEKRNGR
jgi:hypothetical protein